MKMIRHPVSLLIGVLFLLAPWPLLNCASTAVALDNCKLDRRSVPMGACIRDRTCFDVTDGVILFWDCPCSANWGVTATLLGCNRDDCQRAYGTISGQTSCPGSSRPDLGTGVTIGAIVMAFGGNFACDCGTTLRIEITTQCSCYEEVGYPPRSVVTCTQTEAALSIEAKCGPACTDDDEMELIDIGCP